MEAIKAFFRGEPVVLSQVFVAAVAVAAAFGFVLSAGQVAAIVALAAAVSATFARSKVTPVE